MKKLANAYPLVTFLVLTFIFSWGLGLLYLVDISPIPIFSPGPFIAALIVIGLTDGKQGIKKLLKRMVQWRVNFRWYLIAIGIPLFLSSLSYGLSLMFGATVQDAAPHAVWYEFIGSFLFFLLVPAFGGAWEEPGWRGYALPRLQNRFHPIVASLLLSVIGSTWHLPLFLSGDILWSDIALIAAAYIVITWIYNSTDGSLLLVMLIHASNNTFSGEFFSQMFKGSDAITHGWILTSLWVIVAGIVIYMTRGKLASDTPSHRGLNVKRESETFSVTA